MRIAFVLATWLIATTAVAQDIPGSALARFVPSTLGGATRTTFNTYSVFVTAQYGMGAGAVILQIHSVVGAGAEAYLHQSCPRVTRIAGREACVRAGDGHVRVSWVIGDRVQVIMSAVSEVIVERFAQEIDWRGLATVH